jgi:hypothetical protein
VRGWGVGGGAGGVPNGGGGGGGGSSGPPRARKGPPVARARAQSSQTHTFVPLAKERATSPFLPPVGAAGPSGAPSGRAKSALQPWPLHHVGNTGAVGLPPSQHSRHASSVLFAEEKAKLRGAGKEKGGGGWGGGCAGERAPRDDARGGKGGGPSAH